jgi:hypothetical protein
VAGEIARLIGLLDDDSTEIAEDTKAELISIGGEVVQPLVAAIGSLDRYGQLSAIEVFEHFGDAAAGPALIDLLGSEHETVREWSAWAIGELGIREAALMLLAAYRRQRASGDGPDRTEAVAIRHALTVLGARQEVLPPLTASLRTRAGSLKRTWPSARLVDVVNDLADHDQAVLYFQLLGGHRRGHVLERPRAAQPAARFRPAMAADRRGGSGVRVDRGVVGCAAAESFRDRGMDRSCGRVNA